MEIWKDIKDYEGYQASNYGRIRTHNKVTYTKRHGKRHWKNRILKYKNEFSSKRRSKQGIGYRVDLWKDGKPHTLLVHRLIATTFLEDLINTKMTVNHKDGNRYNNNVENLEWLTREDNIKYGFENNQYSQIKTKVTNLITNEVFIFRSMAEASRYFKRNNSYIAFLKSKNRNTFTIGKEQYLVEF